MSSEKDRDIRVFIDYLKTNNDYKETIKIIDFVSNLLLKSLNNGEEGNTIYNFEKISEFIEILWFRINQLNQNEFIQKVDTLLKVIISVILNKLESSVEEFSTENLKTLNLIFSPKTTSYRDSYRYHQDNENDLLNKIAIHESNDFYNREGLIILINKLSSTKYSFENIKKFVSTIKKLIKKVDKIEFNYIDSLVRIVFQKIFNATDEEFKNENKKDLDLIIKYLYAIVSNMNTDNNNLLDVIHHSSLQVSLKCFKSPSLFQRNAGLNDIIRFTKSESTLPRQHHYVPPNKIVEWLKENKVIEILYGETMHIQLLQKCTDILKFLGEQKALDRNYLDLIWSASEGKHETIENAIYETICSIATLLPTEDVDYLFEKIQLIPYNHYTQHTLQLVRSLTQRIPADTDYIPKGLEIFWNLIQDECDINIELAEYALTMLQDSFHYFPIQRSQYLNRCIKNIENHHSVTLSLRLLFHLINSLAERKKRTHMGGMMLMNQQSNNNNHQQQMMDMSNENEVSQILEQIESTFKLVELLYAHLVYYNKLCKGILKDKYSHMMNLDNSSHTTTTNNNNNNNNTEKSILPPLNCDDIVFTGRYTNLSQISDSLNFIRFIYEKSPIQITQKHIDILWEIFVVSPIALHDRTIFFDWAREYLSYDEEFVFYFMNKFKTIQFTNLDIAGFNFYTFCMGTIKQQQHQMNFNNNYNNNNNNNNSNNNNQNINNNITINDIVGLDDLWRILIEARNDEVGKSACAYLIEHYKDFKDPKDFLNTCMLKLSTSIQTNANGSIVLDQENQYFMVQRCLSLVKRYLEDFGSRMPSSFKRTFSPLINIQVKSQKHSFKLEVKSSESIKILKEIVANKMGKDNAPYICFTYQGKFMLDDYETLDDFRILNGDTILFQEIPEPRCSSMSPVDIQFEQSHFHLLFNLLNIQSIAQDVWDLLMLLPANKQILTDITNLNQQLDDSNNTASTNWNQLFDSNSSYKLLYSLLIIESLVIPSSLDQYQRNNPNDWKFNFINQGGAQHLIKILMTSDLQNQSRGNKRNICLSVLLRIIFNILELDQFSVESIQKYGVNPNDLLYRLISLTWNQVEPTIYEENLATHETEDALVVSHLIGLIVAILRNSEALFDTFTQNKDILKWISLICLGSKDTFIRDKATHGISEICKSINPNKTKPYFLQQLLQLLYTTIDSDRRSSSCQQYFEVLCFLLQDTVAQQGSDHFSELLVKLIEMIKSQPIVESTTVYQPDLLLMGLLNCVKILIENNSDFKLLAGQQGGLVKEIFHECLFNIATAENHGPTCPPKCKTKDSRDICFAVLLELAKGCPENLREITTLLMDHHKPEEKRSLWSYFPAGNEKSTCGYVGLKNLGATCYINSLMQQLFMIPGFRYNIIQSEDKSTTPQDQQESLLHQLKIIFANLQESEKKSHDPKDFCLAYKYDGQPINTSVQMDADEFFNMLFDKLENQLKGSHQEKLLQDFFGGSSVNQFISQECNHVSEREEPFYTISVEVKNKKEIQESLQLFVESETLDGDNKYFCSNCSQKVKALMRRCIKNLPNTLIIHNKRFEFDIDLMKRTKLNDALRFPMTIDMEPYTKEYLERKEAAEKAKEKGEPIPEYQPLHPSSYYQYELAGILVHTGTADSGHYYSYIKEREPLNPGEPRRWILFNDQATEVFNPEEISKACFGGYDPMEQGKNNFRSGPRVNNAYMLFYERTYISGEMTKKYENVKPSEASKLVPKDMFSSVWKKNMKFLNDKNIFDPNYFQFLLNIIKLEEDGLNRMDFISSQELLKQDQPKTLDTIDIDDDTNTASKQPTTLNENKLVKQKSNDSSFDQQMQSIELGTRFLIETLFHSKDKKILHETVNHLISLYERNIDACYWLLNTIIQDSSWIRQIFLTCITIDPRDSMMKLLLHVIKFLQPYEKDKYGLEDDSPIVSSISNGMEETSDNNDVSNNSGASVEIIGSSETLSHSSKGKQKASSQMVLDDDIYPNFGELRKPKSIIFKFMDCFLDYIKEAPIHWKHFSHYFLFIKEFSMLGDEERKYLVGRNVIGRLIDFFLGDESPVPRHPPQKKTKMGDKYSAPQFTYALESISILVRSCHTKYSIQVPQGESIQTMPDQISTANGLLNVMPEFDMELLYNPIFIGKAIKDQSLMKSTTEIITYICFNDIETTRSIIGYLESLDGNKSSLEVLLPLITIDDQFREERVDSAIMPYLNILEENFKSRATLQYLRLLVENAAHYQFVSQWFERNLDRWAANWLFGNEHPEVRMDAYNLLLHITGIQMQQPKQEVIRDIFYFLLSSDTIKNAKKIAKREKDSRIGVFRFELYFKFLRNCITAEPECINSFTNSANHFYGLMNEIIFQQNEIDRNRQELTHFVVDVIRDNQENTVLLLKESMTFKLMEYFISISSRDDLKQFNQKSLPSFYEILFLLAKENKQFLEFVVGHSNFQWACKFLLCECGDYTDVATHLFKILELIQTVPKYAPPLLEGFLQFSNFFFYPPHSLQVIKLLMFSKKEAVCFINNNGISVFTKFITNTKDPQDQVNYLPKAIDLLYFILSILRQPQSSTSPQSQSTNSNNNNNEIAAGDDVNEVGSSSSSSGLSLPMNDLTSDIKYLQTVLFATIESNKTLAEKSQKFLNFIAAESPETTITAFTEYLAKWVNKKSNYFLGLQQQSINSVDDPKQQQQYNYNSSSQQPRPTFSNDFGMSEQYIRSLFEIMLIALQGSPENESKGSISLSKFIKEIFVFKMELASQLLITSFNHLKMEQRISLVEYCIQHNIICSDYTSQSPFSNASIDSLYKFIKQFLQEKSNEEIVNNLCTELEDRVATSIASIQSLDSYTSDKDFDTHLFVLNNALRQIELFSNCSTNEKSRQSLNNTISTLDTFVRGDICSKIQSEKAKLFLSNFKSLSLSSTN